MGAALDIQDDSLIGQVLDERYEVIDLLGEGGMGLVYRARHVFSGGEVAVKVLRATALSIPGVLERVEREAIAASSIGDAHIVDVRDFGTLATGEPYMVMELLKGTELAELILEEPELPISRVCHIVDQVARALGAAHEIGIVHRDLKSENVLLVERPETTDFVKLVDFGIAHVQNESSKITRAGELLGTPQYMSPEQCAGRPVDHRTDIYALGVLLYELLTGELPFDSEDLRTLLFAHMATAPTPPGAHRPELPEELEAVVMRCLEKSPDARYGSMDEVSKALAQVPDYTPSGRYTPRKVADSLRLVPATAPSLPPVAQPSSRPPASVTPTAPMKRQETPRWPFMLAAGGAVLGLMAGAVVVASSMLTPAISPIPLPLEPPARVIEAPPETPPAEPAPVREPTPYEAGLTIELDSVEDASVETGDGTLLGTVPIVLPRPEGNERMVVVVSHEGYLPRRVALSALTADTFRVPLDPVAGADAPPRDRPRRRRGPPQSAQTVEPPADPPAAQTPATQMPAAQAPTAQTPAPEEGSSRRQPFLNPWD
ncbi:MAG: protein kinase [Sandaracinaceae bacterium]